MYSAFGGILGFFNVIGGCVLYILVGSKAWGKTYKSRWWRVVFGGAVLGFIVGTIIYLTLEDLERNRLGALIFMGLPLITTSCAIALEALQQVMKDE